MSIGHPSPVTLDYILTSLLAWSISRRRFSFVPISSFFKYLGHIVPKTLTGKEKAVSYKTYALSR